VIFRVMELCNFSLSISLGAIDVSCMLVLDRWTLLCPSPGNSRMCVRGIHYKIYESLRVGEEEQKIHNKKLCSCVSLAGARVNGQ
jgi:hypothetical protein